MVDMSRSSARSRPRRLFRLLLVAGIVAFVVRAATADQGGVYDPEAAA